MRNLLLITLLLSTFISSCNLNVDPIGTENKVLLPAPENLMLQPGDFSISLTWNSVPKACEYMIIRNKEEYQRVADTVFVDIGLDTLKTYSYEVAASDSDGQFGHSSNEKRGKPFSSPILHILGEYRIVKDDNFDGIINQGETITVTNIVKNMAYFSAYSDDLLVIANSPGTLITMTEGSNYHSYFLLQPQKMDTINFSFKTSALCPDSFGFNLYYTIQNKKGAFQWQDTIHYEVLRVEKKLEVDQRIQIMNTSDNNDKIIPGADISIRNFIKNSGKSDIAGIIYCQITKTDSLVSLLKPIDSCVLKDYLNPSYVLVVGDTASVDFSLRVSTFCTADHKFDLYYKLIDGSNNIWYDTVTYTITPNVTSLELLDYYKIILDDNADSILNKGETIKIRNYVKNTGTSKVPGTIRCTMSTADSFIVITSNLDSCISKSAYSYKPLLISDTYIDI